ncbi:MAG: DUF1684 domain-containing protein [Reichenbachiella sp.]
MKKIILIIGTLAIAATIYSLSTENENPEEYIKLIEKERLKKDQTMSSGKDSPFGIYGDTTVKLSYYPVNPKYNLTAKIELIETRQFLTLGSSDGNPVKYQKYAYAKFKIDDKPYQLLILKDPEVKNGGLFTAFVDETSAIETYGAGRYLDLEFKRAKRINLDFNKAYNPYCNYNDNYSCPFPPKDNQLPIRIEAGELIYH